MSEHRHKARARVAAEAADWFVHGHGETSAQERQSFSEWLLRSPAHVQEYLQVASTWRELELPQGDSLSVESLIAAAIAHHDNVVHLPEVLSHGASRENRQSRPARGRSWWKVAALAASLIPAGLFLAAYLSWNSAMTYQTAIGEQRSVTLQDGSLIYLNTNSAVRVQLRRTQRQIDLVRGEARFSVAKDPSRPFTVSTAKAAVRAVGTVFNVRAEPLSTQVAVLQGKVDVIAAGPTTERLGLRQLLQGEAAPIGGIGAVRLEAGQRAAVTSRGIEANAGPPMESVMAWTERRLVFRDQPLGTVVEEFNRYRMRPLVLDDPSLGALQISGVFDLTDPDSLVAYLGAYESVDMQRQADGTQHLLRRAAAVH